MADAPRLDVPRSRARGFGSFLRLNPDAVGQFAEGIARFLGTGRFLAVQTIIVVVWISLNVAAVDLRWDPYPFILLNLAFSTQAAYAAPLILLAQNRQADRDRVQSEEDRARAASIRADTEYLARELASLRIAVGDLATRDFIRGELSRLLEVDGDEEKREKKAKKRRERALAAEPAAGFAPGQGRQPTAAPAGDRHPASD
ncbi:MAG: DUF1003 domain-containing protein [Blastococcus sp.]